MFYRRTWSCNALGKCVLGLIVSGLLLCSTETASAESPELMQAYRQGQALQKKGRYQEAIPFYQKALKIGELEFGPIHPTTAKLINNLAALYQALRRSMLALMNNEEKPHYAHPLFWAPFVVVGEGGTYAVK